ncbi:DNA polymerase Y family protein, partial [Methylobacterium sp. WL69]|uniref:Y-family DNA polymerase n=1 Tax=Methylobacterium sp. WL69 TaxID=2603893 RepID=UPI0011CBA8A1
MPRIVSVWLEHWPVTRLRRAQSGLMPGHPDDAPLVVAAGEATGLRLTAVDARARALGLRPGEPLARARARLSTPLSVHPSDPEADAAALDRLCLWAKRYTPNVAAFGEAEARDGLFLDVAGSSHLFGGEAGLLADLARRLSANGVPARMALAGTPGCAFALARHGAGGLVPA